MNDAADIKVVTVNCCVKVAGFDADDEAETFWIVEDQMADVQENKLPGSSPLAAALLGNTIGDSVPFHPPSGEVELTIVDVQPL